jgi:RNA polymerase subunit RPABC4/transcription elongation factor Spt4
MTFDPSFLSSLTTLGTAFAAAFISALWLSLIFWTYRDIRSRARDPLMRILAVLVAAVLFLPGILVYLILRPSETLDEQYQHTLEEEALLQTIEDIPRCPGCGRQVQVEWMVCPNCHTRLKKKCHSCGKLMELPWELCPYCGISVPGSRRGQISLDEALGAMPPDENEEPIL